MWQAYDGLMSGVAKERPPWNARLVVQDLWVRSHGEWLQGNHPSQTEGKCGNTETKSYAPPLQGSMRSSILSTSSVRRL